MSGYGAGMGKHGRGPRRAGVSAIALALAVAGCGGGGGGDGATTVQRSAVQKARAGEKSPQAAVSQQSKAAASGERKVKAKVVRGPHGSVAVAVPVYVNGKGPFAFILDTGASQSVIDTTLARELKLQKTGDKAPVQGVAGSTVAREVVIDRWRVDKMPLRTLAGVAVGLASGDKQAGVAGLLGSDVLSGFESVAIDYQKQVVTLRPRKR
ncbi:MAG: retropepsin-like aspartic protease [Thermoleophilaceae bacterium]